MHGKEIIDEIGKEIGTGKGCILFDFGCYFPYSLQEILNFSFQIGNTKIDDYKLNNRYPNKNYVTISKKYGRKVSKIGYPYYLDIGAHTILLQIQVGIKSEYSTLENEGSTLIFPIEVTLSEDKPVCGLRMKFIFDEMGIDFISYKKCDIGGWKRTIWTNHTADLAKSHENAIELDIPAQMNESSVIYSTVIAPFPQRLEDLLV